MKKHLILPLIFLFVVPAACTAQVDSSSKMDTATFAKVEKESEYPGGADGWRKFLVSNMRYPIKAMKKNIQGTVIVQFIVDKEGNVEDVEAIEGPVMLGEEGVRLIKASGKWIPAMQNGKRVKSYKKQPFVFRLERG